MKLHVGCGRTILEDHVNVDSRHGPGVDVVFDLDRCAHEPLPFDDNTIEHTVASHIIEHLHHPLAFMADLWRATKPEGTIEIAVPYGSSDAAWEDPTHVRPYYLGSWSAFSAPYYWRADYGYHADWQCTHIIIDLPADRWNGTNTVDALHALRTQRNVATQMTAHLTCTKPARPPDRHLLTPPALTFRLT